MARESTLPAVRARFAALLLSLLASPPPVGAQAPEGFVRVEGERFVLDGAPFAFLGANVAVMHGPRHRDALEATLDAVAADGHRVIRVWALGEGPAGGEAWRRDFAFRLGPEGWVEASFRHLDRVLVAARERGLRVVLVLSNRWADHGGFSRYAAWGGLLDPDASGDGSDGRLPDLRPAELAAFFRCAPCDEAFAAHLRRVVGRTNALTGVAYRDDPTLLAWELANEVAAHSEAGEEALVAWVRRHARAVRALDPHHLISAGHIGWRLRRGRAVWARVVGLEEIDYADSHAYPHRDPRVRSLADLRAWVDTRVQVARALGKPLVFGEVGVPLDARRVRGRARAGWLRAFLARGRRDGVAGALVWIYRAAGRPSRYAIHFDRPGHARDVRALLRREARAWRRPRPRRPLPPADAPRFDPRQLRRGTGALQDRWARGVLALPVERFHRAEFELVGVYRPEDGRPGALHLWGAGEGAVDYRLRLPAGPEAAERLVIEARLSTELPGLGGGGPGDAGEVVLHWDGASLGARPSPPDDGRGSVVRWEVDDPARLRRLLAGRPVRRLRLEADARGLALYALEVRLPGATAATVSGHGQEGAGQGEAGEPEGAP